jgi:acetyl esterase/lipase
MIVIVNFLPLAGTLISTNPSLESQFTDVFGPTWKTDIQEDPTYPFMHQVSFSMYDAYFGYEMPINAKYGQVYMQSHPRYVKDNATKAILSNGSAVFKNITHDLKFDAYLPARPEFTNITFGDGRTKKFPVLIFLHGSGSGVDRGAWNANFTTQYFANLGYAAFDISYGIIDYTNYPDTGGKPLGYDYVDSILQIANFTKYLETHAEYYHADLSNTYVIGRSLGGWMALSVGYLANTTYAGGNFSSQIQIRGVVPFYPASDFPGFGSKFFNLLSGLFNYFNLDIIAALQIRGSSEPSDLDFNPDWLWYNPLWVAENAEPGSLPLTFGLQGTQDLNIPAGAMHRLEDTLKKNGHKVIAAYYPFVGHVFDVMHWSPYGQSVLYYMERMMALTSVN